LFLLPTQIRGKVQKFNRCEPSPRARLGCLGGRAGKRKAWKPV
jgi:hypothetical protein